MSDKNVNSTKGQNQAGQQHQGMNQDKGKPDGLYDLSRDSQNPRKHPEPAEESLQAEPSNLAGNGSQDRRPGKGRRIDGGGGEGSESLGDAEVESLEKDDMPTGRERDHDFSKDDGAELERMRGDGKLDKP